MKICIILGTRPEIIKMHSIIKECEDRNLDFFIIHSGQHYSDNMDKIFFEGLELPQPEYMLDVHVQGHGRQTGLILQKVEQVLIKEMPDIVLVEGDTNTVLAGALAAAKLHINVGHVEAGLRSFDRRMPEEVNRVLADHISDLLFAPVLKARDNLIREGIHDENIYVTGNTIVDAVYFIAGDKSSGQGNVSTMDNKDYFLLTLHRQENVDNGERLQNIFNGLGLVYNKHKKPVIYPVHPRTGKMLRDFNVTVPYGIKCVKPVGFSDFIKLQTNAGLILTDSGGVQEESCILQVPCVTLRDSTERPETLEAGSNILAGADPERILECCNYMLSKENNWDNPFGDGKSGARILDIIEGYYKA